MQQNLVTIIVPVYNVEKYLKKCIDSLVNQTYKNLEIILVNDGSTDNSPNICDESSKADKRVKVIHKENGGLSDARNTGIAVARGDYITFLDSDDYAELLMIERAMKVVKKTNPDIVIWNYYVDYADKTEMIYKSKVASGINGYYSKENFQKISLSEKTIVLLGYAWNKLYKAEIINKKHHLFTKGLSLVEDIVFNAPILEDVDSIFFMNQPFVHYMQRPRETLGAKFYDNFFEMKKLALVAIEELLINWGYSHDEVSEIINFSGFNALKETIRLLTKSSNYDNKQKIIYIHNLLNDEATVKYLDQVNSKNKKDKFLLLMMKKRLAGILLIIYSR